MFYQYCRAGKRRCPHCRRWLENYDHSALYKIRKHAGQWNWLKTLLLWKTIYDLCHFIKRLLNWWKLQNNKKRKNTMLIRNALSYKSLWSSIYISHTRTCFCRLCLTSETFNNVWRCGQCRCTYLQLVECRPNEDNNLLVVYYAWFEIKSTRKCNALKTANEAVWPVRWRFFKIMKKDTAEIWKLACQNSHTMSQQN